METYRKNGVRVAVIAFFILVLVGLAAFTLWRPGWMGNISPSAQGAAAVAADLLTTSDFAVLAGSGITNTGTTVITGDVGTYPTATETGFSTVTITGTNHADDATTQGAKTDLVTAYNALAGQSADHTISADLGGQTLSPGVYSSGSTIGLTGAVTLDGGGDANAVFVFKAGSALTTASASSVVLTNGTQACNVFWQVGSSATLGTGSTFRGTLIALSSITVTTGVTVDGRVLARNGAVTLDTNTIAKSTCSAPPPAGTAILHIIKSVLNLNAGTAVASDFSLHVKSATSTLDVAGSPQNGALTPGTSYTLSPGTYNISEGVNALYTQSYGGACAPSGAVTLIAGDDKICTLINTDLAPPGPVTSNSFAPLPLISIIKIPNPLALPDGPGSVTYTYTVKNIDKVAMYGIWVKDDKCDSVTFVSGDTNSDKKLDIDETWNYRCTKVVSQTVTNIATAHGTANGWDGYDTALATVVVGAPVTPPLIMVTKVPSRLTPFPFGGGDVTYTYTAANPGVVPLHDVLVTDDKCAPLSRTGGDTNADNLLNVGETWRYTCRSNISFSTRNIATASGKANGLVALDYALVDVLVSVPGLPNAGLPPRNMIEDKAPKAIQGVIKKEKDVGFPHLKIPEINVDTSLESVGLTQEGAVDVPKSPTNAGWFDLGPRPGESGNAVIVGHYGWKDAIPAVFDDLHALHKGDKLYIENEKGVTTFVVRALQTYGQNEDAPEVFASNDGKAHLNLITCGGVWDPVEKSYSDRTVVFTDKE
ncbi:DUF3494 domain-containing protein [Candidatus Kaiserbacteria bacterium]|nr:DUF3494 domain-containing protein [Candidatus Kaiserbacteria bacterium]